MRSSAETAGRASGCGRESRINLTACSSAWAATRWHAARLALAAVRAGWCAAAAPPDEGAAPAAPGACGPAAGPAAAASPGAGGATRRGVRLPVRLGRVASVSRR
jgi:hypothetical protein